MSDVPVGTPKEGSKTPGVCAHGPCTCDSGNEMYCSEACKAADTAEVQADAARGDGCSCGHDDCAASPQPG